MVIGPVATCCVPAATVYVEPDATSDGKLDEPDVGRIDESIVSGDVIVIRRPLASR
jgi:hypothetical protein